MERTPSGLIAGESGWPKEGTCQTTTNFGIFSKPQATALESRPERRIYAHVNHLPFDQKALDTY